MTHRYFEDKSHALIYAKHRSTPPKELIDQIISFLKDSYSGSLDLAVDVGCGSGQNTKLFGPHFHRVIGTDISNAMIGTANENNDLKNVSFQVSPAEKIPVENESVQLLSSCEAAHWFDLPKFFEESRRVLCQNGVLALIGYDLAKFRSCVEDESLNFQLNEAYEKLFRVDFGEFVPPEMNLVDRRYKDIAFPAETYKDFKRMDIFYEEIKTTVREISMFCRSWSPYQKYCKQYGEEKGLDLLQGLEDKFMEILGTHTKETENTVLVKKTSYFLLMARKV